MKKNKTFKLLGSASAVAVALSLSPLVGAQTQSAAAGTYNQPSTQNAAADQSTGASSLSQSDPATQVDTASSNAASSSQLRIASKDESKHTAQKLAGKKLRGQDGTELGTVKDFLVDPHSGEVRFAVVSTGGFLGAGDKLHVVPFRQLQQDDKGFTASLNKQQLDQAPALNEEQFEENKVSMQDLQNATSGAMESNGGESGQLVRATKLKSHDVKANGTKIGSLEGVVIEPGADQAVALLDPAKDVTDTHQKFLVPLNRFTISGEKNNEITTTLTRADFQAAGQYNATASTSGSSGAATAGNATALSTQQSQNVAAATGAGSSAPAALGETKSASEANEQAQTASNSTQTTSPLSDESSPSRSTMAANETSSATAQNTASSDQFGASTSQTGQSSGFAQNSPSSATSSMNSSSGSGSDSEQHDMAQNSAPSATSTNSVLSQSEPASVAENANAATSSTSSTDTNQFAAPGSQTEQSAVASSQSSSSTSTNSVEGSTTTPGLAPTGQTSADQNPQADPTLITAAQSIRQALDSDPELGHADVTVTPENGKVVLKGQVASDSVKSQIEKKAQAAANGADIDSQLKVQNQ